MQTYTKKINLFEVVHQKKLYSASKFCLEKTVFKFNEYNLQLLRSAATYFFYWIQQQSRIKKMLLGSLLSIWAERSEIVVFC